MLAGFALLAVAGQEGWSGAPNGCLQGGSCFCEADRGGFLRTPSNSLSNAGFALSGLGIALWLGYERRRGRHPRAGGPMRSTRFYPGAYALVTASIGPGSFALHASLTGWGGTLDVFTMFLFIGFVLVYGIARACELGIPAFLALYAALSALLLAALLTVGYGTEIFGALVVACFALAIGLRRSGRAHSDARWMWAAVATFLTAWFIWLPSRNDGPLCDPHSWLQGHAIWHLLCALATVWIFVFLRSEESLPQTDATGAAS